MSEHTIASSARPAPEYEFPRLPFARFIATLLLGRTLSFARDGQLLMAANPYPRRFEGLEHVPEGPFVLAMNHHNRQGLRPYHCAMMISGELAARSPGRPEVHWAFANQLENQRLGPMPIPVSLIRWVFRRAAHVYGLVTIPRQDHQAMARAGALRRMAALLATAPVGIAPEGDGSGVLIEPPGGVGLFFTMLARTRRPILPVAVWEDGATLVVRFGEPFHLQASAAPSRFEQDRDARDQVMMAIGRMLPPARRGAYAARLDQAPPNASPA